MVTILAILPLSGEAQNPTPPPKPSPAPAPRTAAPQIALPVYKPPLRGAPGGRIGGGTRGVAGGTLSLSVLAPDDRALTVREQPVLYWQLSGRTSFPVEVAIMDPTMVAPLLEITLPGPTEAGVHVVRLADHGIRLQPEIPYRWYVAVVLDSGRRSRDILAGGTVERIALGPELRASLAGANSRDRARLFAEAGLWYDALTAVSEFIDQAPGDPEPREVRAALLRQVGLPDLGSR